MSAIVLRSVRSSSRSSSALRRSALHPDTRRWTTGSSARRTLSSQVKSYSPGEHEGSAQRKPQGPARWGRVVAMHAAAPAASWAAWDECTCAGSALLSTFLSEMRVLASLLLCFFALDGPFRSRKPAFTTGGGPALQRRGPSPEGVSLQGFSGPAAPCALLTARYGKLRTRAWPASA